MLRNLVSSTIAAIALATTALFSPAAQSAQLQSLTPAFREMQRLETKANGVSTRSDQPIAIENYEIPMELIKADVSLRIDPKIAASLIFEKNGKKYLRWIINPEDTKWYKEVETLLKSHGISTARSQYFTGYQTASRSYVLRDPVSGVEFSGKVSTNVTGGNWVDKKQTYEDAWQVRMAYKYAGDVIRQHGGLTNTVFIDEPASFGLEAIDQGMLIRDYDTLKDGKTRLVPGFSVMHEKMGAEIARLNGSNDPAAFWNEHYNKPLARALAEVYAITGLSYDSPHSQNFMVELDANMRPTGRIALRDIGDSYMVQDVFDASGHGSIPPRWEAGNVHKGSMSVAVGLLHGNQDPSWMDTVNDSASAKSYNQWGRDFFKEFESEFKKVTGVEIGDGTTGQRVNKYIAKSYSMKTPAGKAYLDWIRAGRPKLSNGGACRVVFGKAI